MKQQQQLTMYRDGDEEAVEMVDDVEMVLSWVSNPRLSSATRYQYDTTVLKW